MGRRRLVRILRLCAPYLLVAGWLFGASYLRFKNFPLFADGLGWSPPDFIFLVVLPIAIFVGSAQFIRSTQQSFANDEGKETLGALDRLESWLESVLMRYEVTMIVVAVALFALTKLWFSGYLLSGAWRDEVTVRWLPTALLVALAVDIVRNMRSSA